MDVRLSDNDVKVFAAVADSMITAGLWREYRRAPSSGCDFFEISDASGDGNPAYSAGICSSGRYAVVLHRDAVIRFGRTLAEALAHVAFVPDTANAA